MYDNEWMIFRRNLIVFDVKFLGINWDQSKLGRYPTRFDIDTLESSKPVPYIVSYLH